MGLVTAWTPRWWLESVVAMQRGWLSAIRMPLTHMRHDTSLHGGDNECAANEAGGTRASTALLKKMQGAGPPVTSWKGDAQRRRLVQRLARCL